MRVAEFIGFGRRDAHDWRGYVFGAATALLAAFARRALAPALDPLPLVTFLPAISLVAFAAGTAPAILTAALSAGFIFFSISPHHALRLQPGMAIALGSYAVVAAVQILLIRSLRNALISQHEANARAMAEIGAQKVLFRDLQHRVANHLQFIASILSLQKAKVGSDPNSLSTAFDEVRERVVTISRVQRRLYDPDATDRSVEQYLRDFCADLAMSALPHKIVASVASSVQIKDLGKLMSLSLLISEGIDNSLKHAFKDGKAGTITVELMPEGDAYALTIGDDGCGLPAACDPLAARGLGFRMIQALARQLGGRLDVADSEGVTVRVVFVA